MKNSTVTSARKWGEQMTRFVTAVEAELEKKLSEEGMVRMASCDILFAVRKRLRIQDDILEWRLRALLTTAYRMGAFDGSDFELVHGCGWRLAQRRAPVLQLHPVSGAPAEKLRRAG